MKKVKYVIQLNSCKIGESFEALYKKDKLVMFDTEEQAEPVAMALDAEVIKVVPFGDDWINEEHFCEIQYTDLMEIYSENKED